MEIIFRIASSVATPLALGGLFAVILFLIFKHILSKNFITRLTSSRSAEIIKLIVDRLFILALAAMVLGFVSYLLPSSKPTSPQITTSGNGNVTVYGSNNVVSINSSLSDTLRTKSRISRSFIPTKTAGHSISLFEFQEEIPSIQIAKINTLIKDVIWKVYKKNNFYRNVEIDAKPMFIEYGLIGISIDIHLEEMDVKALDANTPLNEAAFLLYMASAHPLEKSTGLVINISNAQPYEFKDLFRFNAMPEVTALMKDILKKSGQYFSCDYEKTIDPRYKFDSAILEKYLGYSANGCFLEVHPNANFYLTSNAVVVKYSRYEIGPGMIGAPEIYIPFDAIEKHINPNGPLAFIVRHI